MLYFQPCPFHYIITDEEQHKNTFSINVKYIIMTRFAKKGHTSNSINLEDHNSAFKKKHIIEIYQPLL